MTNQGLGASPRWRRWRRFLLRIVAACVLIVLGAAVATPTGRYIIRAAFEEGKILARRRSIVEVVGDSTVSPSVRQRLQLVLDARIFARDSLALRPEASFTTFSPLERDTLVLVLSAARRDSLAQFTWWFPVVGSVPYKGFFDFPAALREGVAMRARGLDTYIRPASAFSTLGWFNDPLLSTTLRMDSLNLSNTVIHELTHNTLFVKGKVAFNESLASFVGARGAAAFFRARGGERAARAVEREWEDEKQLGAFWGALAHAIDSAFAAHPTDSLARVRAGEEVYRRMRGVLLSDLSPLMPTVSRAGLERMVLDNASLLARRLYASDLWLFDEVHRRCGRELRRTFSLIARLAKRAKDPFDAMKQWLTPEVGDLRTGDYACSV
ncbi:MAG: aminopeptidase [Gemmatimonadaceae bacterium]